MSINKNMLSPLGFTFNINKLPGFSEFVQSVTIPGVQLGFSERPSPFKQLPVYGDHLTYSELNATFKVNEDMSNYIEIFNWINGLGFPEGFEQYANLDTPDNNVSGSGVESDANIMVMSSAMNPIIRIDLQDLFPIALSDITMDSRDTNVEYIEATASFKFLTYRFTVL